MYNDVILIIVSLFSVMGFSVLMNAPSKGIFLAGICGSLGWATFIFIKHASDSPVFASFIGGMVVGIFGEFFAIKFRRPATIFIVPAILPLVPGYGLYYTMLNLIQKNYVVAGTVGLEAMMVALSVATGLIVSSAIGRIIREIRINSGYKDET
jgi:uncharacterized membrane protein YjjB (DUF3815 family)